MVLSGYLLMTYTHLMSTTLVLYGMSSFLTLVNTPHFSGVPIPFSWPRPIQLLVVRFGLARLQLAMEGDRGHFRQPAFWESVFVPL